MKMLVESIFLPILLSVGMSYFQRTTGYLVFGSESKNNKPKCNNHSALSAGVVVLNETGSVSRKEPWQWECSYAASMHPLTLRIGIAGDPSTLTPDRPILVVIRQNTQVLSWQVPFVANDSFYYWQTERTLCPENIQNEKQKTNETEDTITVTLSTSSPDSQRFRAVAYFLGSQQATLPIISGDEIGVGDEPAIVGSGESFSSEVSMPVLRATNTTARQFELDVGKPLHFFSSPSMPQFFYFQIPADSDKIILRMNSTTDVCAILSVQPALCPVGDLIEQVKYRGFYQTVMNHGAITVSKVAFNTSRFFAVLVVMPEDSECTVKSRGEPLPVPRNRTEQNVQKALELSVPAADQIYRMKASTFTLIETISYADYLLAIFAPIGIILAIVVASLIFQCTALCSWAQIHAKDTELTSSTSNVRNAVSVDMRGARNAAGGGGGYYGTMPVTGGVTPGRYVPHQQRQQKLGDKSNKIFYERVIETSPSSTTTEVAVMPSASATHSPISNVVADSDFNKPAVLPASNKSNNVDVERKPTAESSNNADADDHHHSSTLTVFTSAGAPSIAEQPSQQLKPSLSQRRVVQQPDSRSNSRTRGESHVTFPTYYADSSNNINGSASSEEDLEMRRQVDFVPDYMHERNVIRAKNELTVADLTKKGIEKLRSKDRQYPMSLLTVVIFYCLPVAQLVISYQLQLQTTGNEDLCFYNFDCTRPWYIFSDFGHVVSNSGYMAFGVLFIVVVAIRDRQYRREKRAMDEDEELKVSKQRSPAVEERTPYQEQDSGPHDLVEAVTNPKFQRSASQRWEDERGIPPQFGILYSMGIALIVQGVLSACYHVCPNRSNFQFDSAFMYLIAGLSILRLYQCRHPDIHPQAYIAYLIYAVVISIAVAGVLIDLPSIWIIFSVLLIGFSCFLAMQLYFLGQWSLEYTTFRNLYIRLRGGSCSYGYCMPSRPVSFVLGLLIVLLNGFFGIFGALKVPSDFATYLLTVLLSNGTLYLVYYCTMKVTSKESVSAATITFALLALVTWIGSLYLFLYPLTNSMRTAAQSRQTNKPCFVLDFYDEHDAWHFLSALAVYLSFLVFLTIDDDLKYTPRDKIAVF